MSTWQKYLYISGTAGGGEAGALSISTGERLTTTGDGSTWHKYLHISGCKGRRGGRITCNKYSYLARHNYLLISSYSEGVALGWLWAGEYWFILALIMKHRWQCLLLVMPPCW